MGHHVFASIRGALANRGAVRAAQGPVFLVTVDRVIGRLRVMDASLGYGVLKTGYLVKQGEDTDESDAPPPRLLQGSTSRLVSNLLVL